MFSGSNLKDLRNKQNLSQETLAEMLNIHVNTIRRWEQGKQAPDANKLDILAKALNVPVTAFTDEINISPLIEVKPSTRSSKWMLVYERNGERMELPPTPEGYDIFKSIAKIIANRSEHVTK